LYFKVFSTLKIHILYDLKQIFSTLFFAILLQKASFWNIFKNIFYSIVSHNSTKNVKNSLTKKDRHEYAPQGKTIRTAWLEIFDSIGENISELLKKWRGNGRPGFQAILIQKLVISSVGLLVPLCPLYIWLEGI
jgi:hypothetical protein